MGAASATASSSSSSASVRRPRKPRESLKVIAFDSKGEKKYALQVQKASNGNPCIRIVQGTPMEDGTFRKFDIVVWSEDWPAFFAAMDELRGFIGEEKLKTPPGHKWDPNRPRGNGRGNGRSRQRAA